MKILIDTHFILWVANNPEKLERGDLNLIEDEKNEIICSSISFFEISIKVGLGKLKLEGIDAGELPGKMRAEGYLIGEISADDMASYHRLPLEIHRDPFDRMLIWQAIRNGYQLLTRDKRVREYTKFGLQLA